MVLFLGEETRFYADIPTSAELLTIQLSYTHSAVDETCLKLHPWTIVHPTSPCKYVIVIRFLYRCLLVEGSQSF